MRQRARRGTGRSLLEGSRGLNSGRQGLGPAQGGPCPPSPPPPPPPASQATCPKGLPTCACRGPAFPLLLPTTLPGCGRYFLAAWELG